MLHSFSPMILKQEQKKKMKTHSLVTLAAPLATTFKQNNKKSSIKVSSFYYSYLLVLFKYIRIQMACLFTAQPNTKQTEIPCTLQKTNTKQCIYKVLNSIYFTTKLLEPMLTLVDVG